MTLTALLRHRLLRLCASGHHDSIEILIKVTKYKVTPTFFSTGCVSCVENDDTKSEPFTTNMKLTARQALLSGRKRPLSPLERISSLLPQDSLTPEVEELREQGQLQHEKTTGIQNTHGPFDNTAAHFTEEDSGYPRFHKINKTEEDGNSTGNASLALEKDITDTHIIGCLYEKQPCLEGETLLSFGEMLVAEYRKKGQVEFRKMFQLQSGTRLQSSWGTVPHDDIAGKPAGSFINTNRGTPILIRRASLEDYVLFMKRGPAIAYPKEAASMLMMMDVTNGDCVLEAGSGSGAMSLFLSRAVGASGRVLSVEVREDHQKRAVLNYNRWRTSWELRRAEEWPNNVEFVRADLCSASSILDGWGFNAVALDLINPHLVLPTVVPHLHPGGVCAVYLANITQVIDLLEGLRCLCMPLLCERIFELPVRDWIVAPALQKDGSYCVRKSPTLEEDLETQEASHEDKKQEGPAFGSIPYIARPHPEQMSHTGINNYKIAQ